MSTAAILFASFWLALVSYSASIIVANGGQYVNWPRLVPLSHVSAGKLKVAPGNLKNE